MRTYLIALLALCLSACASAPPPSPEVFESAEEAIQSAIAAGAEELAPVELKFAREKLEAARANLAAEEYDDAQWLAQQSEINSELAIEQSRTAISRRKVNEIQRANELLREELEATYGEDFE